MKRKKKRLLTTLASRVTATASVALVLILLAVTAMVGLGTHNLVASLRNEVGFVVVMSDDATVSRINAVKQQIARAEFTSAYTYVSSEQIEARWNEMTGADSTERAMLASLDVSPFQPEIDVQVKPGWAVADSIENIVKRLKGVEGVERVEPAMAMVDSIDRSGRRIMLILLAVSAVMLVISFMLINNTVRLSVYSRRFIINTMSLVGATDGYIRRPFVLSAMAIGFIGGLIADVFTVGIVFYIPMLDSILASMLPWTQLWVVLVALPVVGTAVCALAALLATNKYLGRSYDSLFE